MFGTSFADSMDGENQRDLEDSRSSLDVCARESGEFQSSASVALRGRINCNWPNPGYSSFDRFACAPVGGSSGRGVTYGTVTLGRRQKQVGGLTCAGG